MYIEVNPHEPFHVLVDDNVLVWDLDQLNAGYQADAVDELTHIWQEGLGEWMRLGEVLERLAAQEFAHGEEEPTVVRPAVEDDTFFVLVSEGDVKRMTLDQLDDSYRLDVIDEHTLIWQNGYTEWVPLCLLLEEPSAHASLRPDAGAGEAGWRSEPTGRTDIPAPVKFQPRSLGGTSEAPMAFDIPDGPPPPSPWFRRSLVAAATLVGLAVLYQHGIAHVAAAELGREHVLESFDARLGSFRLDTPRGVDHWLSSVASRHGIDDLAETPPLVELERLESQRLAAIEAKRQRRLAAERKIEAERQARLETEQEAERRRRAEAAAAAEASQSSRNFGAKLRGQQLPRSRGATTQPPPKPAPAPVFRATGDPNDPLNGGL